VGQRYYEAWCPGCGTQWPALEADDAALSAGEVIALATCEQCLTVTSVVVRQPTRELEKLRREMMKAVQKICQSHVRARTRLEEKRKALAREIHEGGTELVDILREVEQRLVSLRPPDTAHLEKRADEIKAALSSSPGRQPPANCQDCGEPQSIHRETHRGFAVPCPKCTHKLMVRLKINR
jgi:hypothetical protein